MHDPIAELYAVAAALQFLEDSFDCHGEGKRSVRAEGAAYVTGLMGRRVDDIASRLAAVPDAPETGPCSLRPRATDATAQAARASRQA